MILSIDPGKKGGAALFLKNGNLADTYQFELPSVPRMPDDLLDFEKWIPKRVSAVIMEGPADYRTVGGVVQKNTQNFVYGMQYATAVNKCTPKVTELVPARTWKAYFQLTKNKDDALNLARELFPDLTNSALRFKKNDGVAEAILIGLYYMETL